MKINNKEEVEETWKRKEFPLNHFKSREQENVLKNCRGMNIIIIFFPPSLFTLLYCRYFDYKYISDTPDLHRFMSEAKNILKNNILEYFEEHGQLKFCWPFHTRWRRKDGTKFVHVFRSRVSCIYLFIHLFIFHLFIYQGQEPFYTLKISWSCGKVITLIYKNSLMNSWIMGISIHFKIFTYLLSLRSENILEAIESMNCEIYKYKPIRGGSFIPTPPKYARKKAIINIHNTKDNFCLLYSCIAKIRSVKIVSIISHDYEHHQ